MFRLAHISDIHLGPLPRVTRRELFSKRITGYINFRRNRSSVQPTQITDNLISYLDTLAPDHTAITGDLINLGLNQEIQIAKSWLETLGSPQDNTVILGNHDAYVRGARDKAMASWQDWICGDNKIPVVNESDYPVIRRRGEISIICCNSARASAPFLATGYFKEKQAATLKNILLQERENGQCCVILIHHPPGIKATSRPKRLIGANRFREAIKEAGADLILHGHTHLDTLSYIDGPDKSVPVVCVPAAYQWAGHHKPPSGLNILNILRSKENWQIELERHGLSENNPKQFELKIKQQI